MARKILLADDSVTAQNMGRKILTDAGYEVVTVNNGSAALKKIVECKPAIVVLDVYMPGYSGLEVCARIKEGRDTEGIPVLLTVGKLEPFRQEDARKVRADAFIIKPFEATELLAALNKLEAKFGNHSASNSAEPKSTKPIASSMARYEREVADGTPRFGDQESGWKARLTIPLPGTNHEEAAEEPESATMSSRPAADCEREPAERPATAVTPAASDTTGSLHGLPHDVTPDEMAAIAAAAAAVGGGNGDIELQQSAPEAAAMPDRSGSPSLAPATFASQSVAEVEPRYPMPSSSAGPVSAQVEAVLTSFAASHAAEVTEIMQPVAAPSRETMASVAASNSAPMPARWVAEEVPIQPAESALVLEREMHKAFAAFAAAEHGATYEPGPVDKSDEPLFAGNAPPAIGTPTPFASSMQARAEVAPATEPHFISTAPGQSRENSAPAELAQPATVPFTPVVAEEHTHAVVAFGEPHPFGTAERSAPEAARAEQSEAETSPSESNSSIAPAASLPDDWHELRQPLATEAVSNGDSNRTFEDFSSEKEPAAAATETQIESAAMAAAASGDSAPSGAADTSLSSIVDNMLAELKPKLMAELAKKLEKK